jgi:hypothetical protein
MGLNAINLRIGHKRSFFKGDLSAIPRETASPESDRRYTVTSARALVN